LAIYYKIRYLLARDLQMGHLSLKNLLMEEVLSRKKEEMYATESGEDTVTWRARRDPTDSRKTATAPGII
jgi:hypothetical protein